MICLPFFHAFALPIALILPLRLGICTYILPRFRLENFVRAVGEHAITDAPVVPPIISNLNSLPGSDKKALRSLRYLICAGGPMAAGVQGQLYSSLAPDAVITQCWGTTETGWITLFNATEKDTSGSVGHLLPNIRMKVWASSDTPALTRTPGEALIHSPVMFSGYLGDPKATANAFDPGGFYRTGDLVLVKGDRVFYSGRLKETLKVNGWQVSPTEIEILLLQHPLISDAAVAAITTDTEGDIPRILICAYVVRQCSEHETLQPSSSYHASRLDESPLTERDVEDFVHSRLISYKHLTGGVVFVEEIPRSNTGKILRGTLGQDGSLSTVV